jgi:hypothetical protein
MLLVSIVLLSGCASGKPSLVVSQGAASGEVKQTQVRREADRLTQCQQELEALEGIDPERHKKLHQEFDRLMSGAAQYAGLRTRVNSETQETVDALYRYKANRMCANITQAMLTGLAERGEQLK